MEVTLRGPAAGSVRAAAVCQKAHLTLTDGGVWSGLMPALATGPSPQKSKAKIVRQEIKRKSREDKLRERTAATCFEGNNLLRLYITLASR